MTIRPWWLWGLGIIGVAVVGLLAVIAFALLSDDQGTSTELAQISKTATPGPSPTVTATPSPVVQTQCPKPTACPGPTACPPSPTCPQPVTCATCPEPITCPTCPTCPEPVVCPECPACPPPAVCPTCPISDCSQELADVATWKYMAGECAKLAGHVTCEYQCAAKWCDCQAGISACNDACPPGGVFVP